MRVLRLRLHAWRGIDDREVVFSPTGVTVVEGPNEVGKSSLLEALDLLLEEQDSTAKAKVRSVKAVHRDEGPEVEAELEAGPYRLVCRKRFLKRPETVLTVTAPRPESQTGRPAHERLRALLEETTDLDLWRALRIDQGEGLVPAQLASAKWLADALERAAGGTAGGDRERTLLGLAEEEYLRWWTPTGKEGRALADPAEAEVALADEVARVREDLRRIEHDVARAADLARERVRLAASEEDLRRRAEKHEAEAKRLEALRLRKERREKERALADAALKAAEVADRDRQEFVQAAETAAADVAARERALAEASPDVEARRDALEKARRAAAEARAAADRWAEDVALRERDLEFRRDELDLAQLRERLARVVRAELEAASAAEALRRNRVDEKTLAAIRKARDEVVRAQALADAAAPTLRVEANRAVELRVAGAPVALADGEVRAVPVSGPTRIELPGVLCVEVTPGPGAAEPRKTLDQRREEYRAVCAEAGVEDADAAEAAHAERREARRVLDERDRKTQENLRDLTREQVERKIANLVPRVEAWPRERPSEPKLPGDFDGAQSAARVAREAAAAAAKSAGEAERIAEAARKAHEEAASRLRGYEGQLQVLRGQAKEKATRLEEARRIAEDAELQHRRAAAATCLRAADDALVAAQRELDASGADTVATLAANARAAADDAARELRRVEDERLAVASALEATGESGLGERLAAKESELGHVQRDLASRRARAAAARRLFEALRAARDAARARYVAPLRERIEQLGRVVFGPTFRAEIGDDLSLVSRTVDDRTVPFESLSGGAREQLGVIARLACAQIVEEQGGLPVVLDDALGFSDPRRLEEMGALLAQAGRRSQVIVLTCFPDRYRHVGGAHVVRM